MKAHAGRKRGDSSPLGSSALYTNPIQATGWAPLDSLQIEKIGRTLSSRAKLEGRDPPNEHSVSLYEKF